MQLILASQSPRRKELLGLFGVPFTIAVADIDETMDPALPPQDEVARVSRLKAMATPREDSDVVVAADTIVVCRGRVLGKPHSREEAKEMLQLRSGRDHQVMTGVSVLRGEKILTCTEVTDIHFRDLTEKEIDDYIRTGEPMDKAGSYGIQCKGVRFVKGIVGDYFNVVGLPVSRLSRVLERF